MAREQQEVIEDGVVVRSRMETSVALPTSGELSEFLQQCGVDPSAATDEQIVARFQITDGTRDRHGDTVNPDGWDLKSYNGVNLWAHMSWQPPVGKALRTWKHNGTLRQLSVFTPRDIYPFGHMIGRMYQEEFLKDVSVGFLPTKMKMFLDPEEAKAENRELYDIKFEEQELIENSMVPVGANRNANLIKAFEGARAAGIDTSAASDWAAKCLDMAGADMQALEKIYFEHNPIQKSYHEMPAAPSPLEQDDRPTVRALTQEERALVAKTAKELFRCRQ